MKKKPIENASTVNDEELIINNEEPLTIKKNDEQTVQLPEAESSVTSKNVIKTRH